MASADPFLWYRDKDQLKLGEVARYTVEYTLVDPDRKAIFFRLKNIEKAPIRAIHLLNGPFILYCHVVPCNYDHKKPFVAEDPDSNKEVVFENQVKPGQTFNVELCLNKNSFLKKNGQGDDVYQWSIDIVSQIFIRKSTTIQYDLMLGDNIASLKKLNHRRIATALTFGSHGSATSLLKKKVEVEPKKEPMNPQLEVVKLTTPKLWSSQPKNPDDPVHLIILTHGIFSNVTGDMLYLKEALELNVDDNILVRGFEGNVTKNENGIKKLGIRLHTYILNLLDELENSGLNVDRISFVAHSLGGPVQLYAIKEILETKGSDFFFKRKIKPTHLVFMACPLLGVLSELNILLAWFLDIGTLGKTGRDLTLLKRLPSMHSLINKKGRRKKDAFRPLLLTLPEEPLQRFFKEFDHLTLYANAVNDGIVPLRTSSLLFLDYEALGDVNDIRKEQEVTKVNEKSPKSDSKYAPPVAEVSPTTDNNNTRHYNAPSIPDSDEKEVEPSWCVKWKRSKKLKKKHKRSKRQRILSKINAKGVDSVASPPMLESESSLTESPEANEDANLEPVFNAPPKASAVESALNTLLCPIPSYEYISKPESRPNPVFHDKFYHFENIPAHSESEMKAFKHPIHCLFNYNTWKLHKQAMLARKYHTPGLTWRKVLVNLPPDAHNNIVVRRRFANGYGWGVVDHLCSEVFNNSETEKSAG